MMNCLRNSRSRLLPRMPTTVYPPRPLPARYYYASRVPSGNAASRPPPQLQQDRRRFFFTSQWRERLPFLRKVTMVGGGAVAMYLGTREVVPYTNRTHFIVLPRKLERYMGEFWIEGQKKKMGSKVLPPLHPDTVRVHRIASEIVDAFDHHRQKAGAKPRTSSSLLGGLEVILVKDDMIRATCVAGGKIVVHTAVLDKFREDAEIATVLGHEIAHAIARHAAESITEFIMHFVTLEFIYRTAPERAIEKRLWQRRNEVEADYIGLLLVAAAGYDPRALPLVYEKLEKFAGEDRIPSVDDYHPLATERVQMLSQPDVMNKALELYRGVRPCSNPL